MEPPTTGPSRRGARAYGTEKYGAFTVKSLADIEAQAATFKVRRSELTGKPPAELLPGLRLLREFRYPHGLRVARPFGPVTHLPVPLPEGTGTDAGDGLVFDIVHALATIQDHTTAQLRVPDLAELAPHQIREFLRIADLMRGAAISMPWEELAVHLRPGGGPPPDALFSMLMYQELFLSTDGRQASLGYQQVHLPAVRVAEDGTTDHEDRQDIRIVPAGGAPAVIRYAPKLPANPSRVRPAARPRARAARRPEGDPETRAFSHRVSIVDSAGGLRRLVASWRQPDPGGRRGGGACETLTASLGCRAAGGPALSFESWRSQWQVRPLACRGFRDQRHGRAPAAPARWTTARPGSDNRALSAPVPASSASLTGQGEDFGGVK